MLVEHEFVTTLDQADAFDMVRWTLAADGFEVIQTSESSIELRRGKSRPHEGDPATLPQTVRMVFDRGRVNVACALMQPRGVKPIHRQLMLSLVDGIEQMLVHFQPGDEAMEEFRRWDSTSSADHRKQRRSRRILLRVLAAAIIVVVLAIVLAAQ